MQDLKDLTHDVHYENYRTELIQAQKEGGNQKKNTSCFIRENHLSSEEADKLLQAKDIEVFIIQLILIMKVLFI